MSDDTAHLGDMPLKGPCTPEADRFIERCQDLKDEANWAYDTIEGIITSVRQHGTMTLNQIRAIDNIEAASKRERRPSGGRRYEGWGRR